MHQALHIPEGRNISIDELRKICSNDTALWLHVSRGVTRHHMEISFSRSTLYHRLHDVGKTA